VRILSCRDLSILTGAWMLKSHLNNHLPRSTTTCTFGRVGMGRVEGGGRTLASP
jgi:hypothetical protein